MTSQLVWQSSTSVAKHLARRKTKKAKLFTKANICEHCGDEVKTRTNICFVCDYYR